MKRKVFPGKFTGLLAPYSQLALVLLCLFLCTAHAEEESDTGDGRILQGSARLRFQLESPAFLYFRLGTADPGITNIEFTVPPGDTGNGTPVCGVGGIGNSLACPAGSASAVEIQCNTGQVTIQESNNSGGMGMGDGSGNHISYSQIQTNSADVGFPAPVLSDSGGNTVMLATTSGSLVTNRLSVWEYTYKNAVVPAPGTYGTSTNGGRVTYTASAP